MEYMDPSEDPYYNGIGPKPTLRKEAVSAPINAPVHHEPSQPQMSFNPNPNYGMMQKWVNGISFLFGLMVHRLPSIDIDRDICTC